MAAALVRKVNATDAATTTATTVITVDATGFAAGTTLIAGAFWRTAVANALTGVTDSKGNTWQVDGASTSAATGIAAASAYLTVALVSGDTITLTWAGNVSGRTIQINQFSGLVTASWSDGAGVTAALTGTTVNGAAVTTANANDLIVEFFGTTSNVTVLSNAAGWTTTGTQASLAGPTKLDSIYQEFLATGTYQGSVTYSGASASGRQISIAYKVAAAAAGAVTQTAEWLPMFVAINSSF